MWFYVNRCKQRYHVLLKFRRGLFVVDVLSEPVNRRIESVWSRRKHVAVAAWRYLSSLLLSVVDLSATRQ